MRIKTLFYGLSIMILNNILVLATVYNFHLRSFVVMFIYSLVALVMWKFLLKKDVSIGFMTINIKIIKQTLPLIIIPLIAIAYFLNTANTINYNLLSLMFITSLTTGIYEELIFRGIAFGSLIKANVKPKYAIFISAGFFALFHLFGMENYTNIDIGLKLFNTFIMGVIFAYIYFATNNIFYIIVMHTVLDFESFVDSQYQLNNIGLIFPIILFAMSVLYCTWSCKQFYKLDKY